MDRFTKLINDFGVFAQSQYPNEGCGIVTKDFCFIPCKNLSPYPKNSFILDPISLLKYDNNIWGIFHSHPGEENPLPSEEDLQHTVFDEYKFIVGFSNTYYIYSYNKIAKMLVYEPFNKEHLIN